MHEKPNLEQEVYQIRDRVSHLWRSNMKTWDFDKIITIFGQRTWDALVYVPIIAGTCLDKLCWELTSNGQCTSKNPYKMLAVEEATNSAPTNIPMRVLQILRQVWADKII